MEGMGSGGFRHGVICQSIAKPGAVAPFLWSGKRTANSETPVCSLVASHHGEVGDARPLSAEAFFQPGQVALFLMSCRCGVLPRS